MEVELSKGSVNRYWRRRRYRRLDAANRKNVQIVRFGGPRRRSWKIKIIPKLRLMKRAISSASPMKLWARFKNAYINMMLNLAGNVGALNDGNVFRGKRIPTARQVPTAPYSNDEFENRLVFEIYKALMASRELSQLTTTTATA
ncbi:uncharacterized protein LOC132282193 [Cornus florida]|uniref:uncharacterized protein LOC132282193 n=1 Tax=Cornus florida TaxID=4283 RepID=UPI00289EA418|nr:uncharacterized protein LOC132282193 [Cornus florida]